MLLTSTLFTLNVLGKCHPGYSACQTEEWSKWFPCEPSCGGERRREKYLCCESTIVPHILENCLKHCNITKNWWDLNAVEIQSCTKTCVHGSYNPSHNNCTCFTGYIGSCCEQGMINSFTKISV